MNVVVACDDIVGLENLVAASASLTKPPASRTSTMPAAMSHDDRLRSQ